MQRRVREHGAQPVPRRDLDLPAAVQARDRRRDRRGRQEPGEAVVEHGEREPVGAVRELRERKADEARVAEARGERQCPALVPLARDEAGIAVAGQPDEPAGEDRGAERAAEALVEIDGEERDEDEHGREGPEERDPDQVAQPRRRAGELHGGPEQEEEEQQEALGRHSRRLLARSPRSGASGGSRAETGSRLGRREGAPRRVGRARARARVEAGAGTGPRRAACRAGKSRDRAARRLPPGAGGGRARALLGLARSLDVDLAVIGPEAPLVAGVADVLRRNGVASSARAARRRGSRARRASPRP